jgi:lipopolysaccharide export system permease protein
MISAMFTVAWIQRHNEMTALLSAGVPLIRILAPVIVAVTVVSLFSAASRELVIPRYRGEFSRRPQDPLGDQPQMLKSCYDSRSDVVLGGKSTYAGQKRIEEPMFLVRSPTLRQYGSQIVADNAFYRPPDAKHPGGYLLDGMREPKNLDSRPSLFLDGEAMLITPHDADWLKPNQCFLRSDLDFDFLLPEGDKAFRQYSSTGQLITALRNPSLDYGADVRVAIHSRIVKPLLDVTLLFLGLPLVVARESRNVFLAMGLCMAVTVAFSLTVIGFQQLGEASWLVTPALAAWAPLMVFVPLAVWMAESLWN